MKMNCLQAFRFPSESFKLLVLQHVMTYIALIAGGGAYLKVWTNTDFA